MGRKNRITIRIDERTGLIIDELSVNLGTTKSKVIRALLKKCTDELIDSTGNLNLNGTKSIQKE